jgi:hypothetical protein
MVGGNPLAAAAIEGALAGGSVGFAVLNIVYSDYGYLVVDNVIRFAVYGAGLQQLVDGLRGSVERGACGAGREASQRAAGPDNGTGGRR